MINNTKLSSGEETRPEFNPGPGAIKLGIDVHQVFYVVVMQAGGTNPEPAQRFSKEAFLDWATQLRRKHPARAIHAVYEACGFGFGLQRELAALGIHCYVTCPQKLDEQNKRVKTDGRAPKRSASNWIVIWKATMMRSPCSGCRAQSRNNCAPFTGSANS